ncbi:glycosyltransferase family 4 protein [Mesorhizobium sp. RMAD-H1]|uniref:glycosyltransferase family 4 protein n=1 Tax=Mesorhizobium sp. RMAD-H1 TaxID=2587065 RepID=UPI00161B7B94|nr:glycosyltransferase family 4 protein [Mesorhizobium sp. RMAD-H1]MBB2969611.1 glycosyltransferase involved in cell wall biosynthesis [Mesorhizobium sp. RMAD-H1]
MRILFANRYFHPDQSATSRMVSSLAFSLARDGIEVEVIASRHYYNRPNEFLPAEETVNGVRIHRLWTSGFGRRALAGRAADYATFHLSAMAWWLRHARRDDICVLCTDPPLLAVSSALPIRLRGAKLVNWVMDLFPETAMELGMLRSDTLPGRTALGLRNWSMRRSALTICPIEAMARHLAGQGIAKETLRVVHHWSDKNEIRPVKPDENRLRRTWKLGRSFVIGYSGNFGRAHEFATVLDAAEKLLGVKGIRFLFIGDGQQRPFVEAEVQRRGLSNVVFKPFQPVENLQESLSVADVHLVSLLPQLEHCIIPSKFYGVLAAGRPTIFIGDPDGEVGSTVRTFQCGEAVRPGDVAGLIDSILRLKHSRLHLMTMGNNARYLLETAYSREYGTDAWQSAIAPLTASDEGAVMPSLTSGALQ